MNQRRVRRRQQDMDYVLEVAERLFAEKGFIKVTMRELSQKAEFALGTIYSFFKGKRQLYEHLMERKLKEYIAVVKGAISSESQPRQQLEKFIEAKLTFVHQNRPFLRLHLAGKHGPPPTAAGEGSSDERPKHVDDMPVLQELVSAFRRGISSGVFAKADPNVLATALDGLTSALALSWLKHPSDTSPKAEIETAKRIFFRGVLADATGPNI